MNQISEHIEDHKNYHPENEESNSNKMDEVDEWLKTHYPDVNLTELWNRHVENQLRSLNLQDLRVSYKEFQPRCFVPLEIQ